MHLFFALLSGGSPIDLDGTFFVQLLIFVVAFFALRSLVFQPVMRVFDAREEAIDGAREDAKRVEAEAQGKAAAFEDEMARVKASAGDERERLRQEGSKLERAILDRVRLETQSLTRDASQSLAAEGVKIRTELHAKVPVLAKDIATKLLGREVE